MFLIENYVRSPQNVKCTNYRVCLNFPCRFYIWKIYVSNREIHSPGNVKCTNRGVCLDLLVVWCPKVVP